MSMTDKPAATGSGEPLDDPRDFGLPADIVNFGNDELPTPPSSQPAAGEQPSASDQEKKS